MPLRLVEIVVPVSCEGRVGELIKDHHVDMLPNIPLTPERMMVRLVLEAEEAEDVIEKFSEAFSPLEGFRINLIPLEATIPEHGTREDAEKEAEKERKKGEKEAARKAEESKEPVAEKPLRPVSALASDSAAEMAPSPVEEPPKATMPTPSKGAPTLEPEPMDVKRKTKGERIAKEPKRSTRISRDELYSDLSDAVKFNITYFALVALSVLVAAVGLVQNNPAVIIGAMVIAPLLAPNVALSLSTTLANRKLAGKALLTLSLGIILALLLSYALGVFLEVDPTTPEIALRTKVGFGDIVVGLAAGAAAALFFSLGMGTALVGVTVAVALLPPLVVTGLLAGAGRIDLAWQSLLLLVSNLIGINLAGTVVFILQGVWPSSWWEEKKAKRTALSAVLIWILLFLVLVFIILVVEHIIQFQWTWPFVT